METPTLTQRWFAFVNRIPLLRWLFVIRKAYLIKAWKVHYSQWGEDVVLDRFLNKVPRGCYIDVGCYHPRKHSNTYRLHRLGWRGINVDVDPIKKAVFDRARPDDENLCCAVGNTPGEATIYTFGHYSLLNTLDPDKAAEYQREGNACTPRPIQVRRLSDIVDRSRFAGQPIALLSIDVEGHEEAVLRSLDFSRQRPAVILVEFHVGSLAELAADPRYRLLTGELGYEMVNWTGLTVFFMDRRHLAAPAPATATAPAATLAAV